MFQVRKNGKSGVRSIEDNNPEDKKLFIDEGINISTNKRHIILSSKHCLYLFPFIFFFLAIVFVLFIFTTIYVTCLGIINYIIIIIVTYSFIYKDLIFIKDD